MTLFTTIAILSVLGAMLATVLYFVALKFQIIEDPRIDEVENLLPGVNCGGCGFSGCRAFASAAAKADTLAGLWCPVGGDETVAAVAGYLGMETPEREPLSAYIRCSGSCDVRPSASRYDGAGSCAVQASFYSAETGCVYGCLGKGDCVAVCNFGALRMNIATGLPEVDRQRCTACGACERACPKLLIELRPKGHSIYVSCRSCDKGGAAVKACAAACIGCTKCFKACSFGAIVVESNLAYIDSRKCTLCSKCISECPTGAILETGFSSCEDKAGVGAGAA